jgi:hypothetical protein
MGNLDLARRHVLRGGLALAGAGLLVGCGVRPGPPASPTERSTVGVLLFSTPAADVTFNAFLQGLGALGYREGENLAIETRYAEGKPERLPELADALVRLKPDVIFALGGDVVADAKRATGTIPVVFAISADPVQSGFVANLAGVMGAYMVKFPHSRVITLVPLFIFLTTMEIPAVLILAYWFLIQIFSGVGSIGYSNVSSGGGVAWFAHVGGFVAGMILIFTLGTRERFRHRRDLSW